MNPFLILLKTKGKLKCGEALGFLEMLIMVNKLKGKAMSPSCPISTKRVDTNMMRIISFQVVIFTLALIFTQEKLFALILLFDFSVRILRITTVSPFYIVGKFMLSGWGAEPKFCDESPKRFALYLGLFTSLLLVLFVINGAVEIATLIAVILLTCALLETLFDFCIGCKIYYAIQWVKATFKNDRNLY
jgi:hypothetical protein